MLTPEKRQALAAVKAGDPYAKAASGPRRAGRTRTIRALLDAGLLRDNPHGYGVVLTDAGKAALGSE